MNEANRKPVSLYSVLKSRPFGRGFAAYRMAQLSQRVRPCNAAP